MKPIKVVIWNEFRHEKTDAEAMATYPNGLHACIKDGLSSCGDMEIVLASLDEPDQGLPDELLNSTDVLIWWAHCAHGVVDDALAKRIQKRVYLGKNGLYCPPRRALLQALPYDRWLKRQPLLGQKPKGDHVDADALAPDRRRHSRAFPHRRGGGALQRALLYPRARFLGLRCMV